jgi:23S rRNA pseudouridine2605 synthase
MTNNGALARDLELPKNKVHRTYRVRVHGKLTPYKLKAMRSGITIGNIRYNGMKVEIENTRKKGTSTNTWLRITCTQGKNRQIRNVLAHLASKYGVGAMVVA